MVRNKSLPSKFQKLLASKFNESFQSVFTTTAKNRSGSSLVKKEDSPAKTGEIVIQDSEPKVDEDGLPLDPNAEQ